MLWLDEKKLLAIAIVLKFSAGQNLFIHQQDVELTVPITEELLVNFEINPLILLKFTDLQSTNHSSYKFSLPQAPDFLSIDEATGKIFFIPKKWTHAQQVQHLRATIEEVKTKSKGYTTLKFNFVKTEKEQFCLEHSCFYDQIRFMTLEYNNRKKTQEQTVGEIIPPIYRKFCDGLQAVYFLDNGTKHFEVSRKNQLLKLEPLDFDNQIENISLRMSCEVKNQENEDLNVVKKLIKVTVVDRNDNAVYVDEDSRNVKLFREELEFDEGDIVNRSQVIIFRDLDSMEANSQIEITLIDKFSIFSHKCTPTTWVDGDSVTTMIICDIYFNQSGRLNMTDYCIELKAADPSLRKNHFAVSHICVITKSSTEEASTSQVFPSNVYLSQDATVFARVAQPLHNTNATGFRLSSDFFGAFNITETGGIVYLARPSFLGQALSASVAILEVIWKEQSHQISVTIQKGDANCKETSVEDFCARHETQEKCESSCGIGSGNGRCKWRSHQGFELMSSIFATCISDSDFCGDQQCDQLEMLGSSLKQQLCPQDCTQNVIGGVKTKALGISGAPKGHVCTCDESEECLCGPNVIIVREEPKLISTMMTTTTMPEPSVTQENFPTPNYYSLLLTYNFLFGVLFLIVVIVLIRFICISSHKHHQALPAITAEYCGNQFIKSPEKAVKFEKINECEKFSGYPEFYSRRWELDITKVAVERLIGEGEFGKVLLASLKDFQGMESTSVVIKTVKDVQNESEVSSLKKEFEQLQKVSIHPHSNVITLIGCYSKGPEPLIFLEFCVFESLKDYLMASRLIPFRTNINGVDKVTSDEVLRFSLQIASGMAHLAELKLVHRDLAARNVLLSEGKICKISDFGLTRGLCNSCDTYSKCSNDKVPVKWLAPESLTAKEDYSTKSDVWAFGILGYELIMLGGTPYPNVASNHRDILSFLTNGNRMKRPINCSPQLYAIYESCWQFEPSRRPSFDDIARKFESLMLLSDQSLWSVPEFSAEEMRNFNEGFCRRYIERVRKACSVSKRKQQKRRRSEEETKQERPESCFIVRRAPSFQNPHSSRSMNSVDNISYINGSLPKPLHAQSFEWNLRKAKPVKITFPVFSAGSMNDSGFELHYLPMKGSTSRNLLAANVSLSSSSTSGYVPMENMISSGSSNSTGLKGSLSV